MFFIKDETDKDELSATSAALYCSYLLLHSRLRNLMSCLYSVFISYPEILIAGVFASYDAAKCCTICATFSDLFISTQWLRGFNNFFKRIFWHIFTNLLNMIDVFCPSIKRQSSARWSRIRISVDISTCPIP